MELKKGRIINVILVTLFLVFAVIAVYPFWPSIKYKLFLSDTKESDNLAVADSFSPVLSEIKENLLIIPKIGVRIPIVEGKDESMLDKGAWRIPQTSTPDKNSNTVLTAHRWKYRPPSEETFYLLDKLEIGDSFQVYWQGFEYDYQVASISIVLPTELDVLNPTSISTITLITCTPLFSTAQRLVVGGKRIR